MTLTAKDKKQIMIVAGLLFVFAIVSKDSFGRVKKSQERLKKARLVKAFASTGVVSPAMTGAAAPAETAVQGGGIDPFSGRPISFGPEGAASSFKLSGIVCNPQNPSDSFAIINNRPYKTGESISNTGMKIVDINSQEVTISDGKSTKKMRTW